MLLAQPVSADLDQTWLTPGQFQLIHAVDARTHTHTQTYNWSLMVVAVQDHQSIMGTVQGV